MFAGPAVPRAGADQTRGIEPRRHKGHKGHEGETIVRHDATRASQPMTLFVCRPLRVLRGSFVRRVEEKIMRSWSCAVAALALVAGIAAPVGAQGYPAGGMPPMMQGGSKPSPQTAALEKKAQQLEAQY